MRYQVRELGLGKILDQAVTLTKNHFGLLLGVAAVLQIPFGIVQGLLLQPAAAALPDDPTIADILAMQQQQTNLFVLLPLILLNAYVVVPLTNGAMVYAIANVYLDQPISVGKAFARVLKRLFGMIGTYLLVGLAIMGGLLLCIVPGILAILWFMLATQVVVIEGLSGFAALKRSRELMKGNIVTLIALFILLIAISLGVELGGRFIPQHHLQIVAVVLIQAVLAIFFSAVFVVFYFSCRCRHEQFDLALLAQSVGVDAPSDPAAGT
jgi:hypothetical protein